MARLEPKGWNVLSKRGSTEDTKCFATDGDMWGARGQVLGTVVKMPLQTRAFHIGMPVLES